MIDEPFDLRVIDEDLRHYLNAPNSQPCFLQIQSGAEGMFDGPLPQVGDAVEMVCVQNDNGNIILQLRVRSR